jgi:CRISPR-associated protein Cst2
VIKFVTFAVKTQLNIHDLNNEAVAGNVTDIRIMEFLDEDGKRMEAPAVSGRMLKHWHLEGMRHLVVNGSYSTIPLCAGCKSGEPIRPGKSENSNLTQVARPEEETIQNCAVCDIHGYLIAQGTAGKDGKDRGVSSRRTSRAMFSWLMPVLGSKTTQKQVIHTRVSQQQSMAEGQSAAQMIFNKSYASGIYAFVSALDVDRIGLVELNLGTNNPYAVNDNDRKERIKVALEAYRLMISGQIGASLSHALPHQNLKEVLVCYSEQGPLPFPVSPMYPDYLRKSIGILPEGAQALYLGADELSPDLKNKVQLVNTLDELFKKLLGGV